MSLPMHDGEPHSARPLLEVDGLSVEFGARGRWMRVLDDVSFQVGRSETLGLVGESGSGKSVTALTVMGLVESGGGRVAAGSVRLDGQELTSLGEREWRRIRGGRVAMIFQQPSRTLNPAFTVGAQIAEAARIHHGLSRAAAWARAVELLDLVHIKNPAQRAKDYTHQFSGGMCQRAMIALALVGEPELLIADEPTTALDVTVQAHILDLLREVQERTQVAVLFISHDLAVVSRVCDRIAVMYAGQVVETASTPTLLMTPQHPYSAGLLASVPRPGQGRRLVSMPGSIPNFAALPEGCRFSPRCEWCTPECAEHGAVELVQEGGRVVRCVHPLAVPTRRATG